MTGPRVTYSQDLPAFIKDLREKIKIYQTNHKEINQHRANDIKAFNQLINEAEPKLATAANIELLANSINNYIKSKEFQMGWSSQLKDLLTATTKKHTRKLLIPELPSFIEELRAGIDKYKAANRKLPPHRLEDIIAINKKLNEAEQADSLYTVRELAINIDNHLRSGNYRMDWGSNLKNTLNAIIVSYCPQLLGRNRDRYLRDSYDRLRQAFHMTIRKNRELSSNVDNMHSEIKQDAETAMELNEKIIELETKLQLAPPIASLSLTAGTSATTDYSPNNVSNSSQRFFHNTAQQLNKEEAVNTMTFSV
jgi:hypothetical protein